MMIDYREKMMRYRNMEMEVLSKIDINAVNIVLNVLEDARRGGRHIFICGNGGSAATASHYAGDFNMGVNISMPSDAPKYRFEALNDNIPTMMAIANDESYEEVFRYSLSVKMEAGDVVIGVSGSGNSQNVINAFDFAASHGGKTIAIVGYDGGRMKEMADYCVHIEINDMQISEDMHMMIDHMMMWVLTH